MLSMRKVALLFSLALASPLLAEPTPQKYDLGDISKFIEGEYVLIGRQPESKATYTGRLIFRVKDNGLEFSRVVGGQTQTGNVTFDTKTDESGRPILRTRFLMDGKRYEATYLWSTDLSNFARLTGYVYLIDRKTKFPGLEALFALADYNRDFE